jgi:hypothetical protein
MKKTLAIILIVFFVLMIIGASSQTGKNHHQPGDVAGALGELVGMLLLFAGLYYSAKWLMKLSGHTYKVGRQTWAALLFWYSVFAAFIGLIISVYERNTFGFPYGAVMLVIWSGAAYACKRWQRRLRTAELAQHSAVPQGEPA